MAIDLLQRAEQTARDPIPPAGSLTPADVAGKVRAERLRISRDLHDQTAQQVAMVKFNLEDLKNEMASPAATEKLNQAIWDVEQLAKDLHAIVHGLRMSAVERFGLLPSLDAMIADWGRRFGIAAQFRAEGADAVREPAVENVLFSVAQEALTNVAKHALTAKAVFVTLRCTKSEILLTVADDGGGFDQEAASGGSAAKARTFGLIGLRERLALIGGELIVSSGASGTSVTARVSSRSQ